MMPRRWLVTVGCLLAIVATLLMRPTEVDAGCWCDVRVLAVGPNFCNTAWEGWRGSPGTGTQICDGDPGPCWVDYYTNGMWTNVAGFEWWRSFTSVNPVGASCSPLVQPVATWWKTPELGMHLHARAAEIRRFLVQARGLMAYVCAQAWEPRVRAMCPVVQALVGALTAQLVMATNAALDPPNPDYAALPLACTQSPGPPLTLAAITVDGVTPLTQAQLDAWTAWINKGWIVANRTCQAHDAWERASGAVLASDAPWARRLSRAYDAHMAAARVRAGKERAARPGALAPFDPLPTPAACPPTADRVMVDAVTRGVDPEQAVAAAAAVAGPCVEAGTWPAFLLESLADEAALDAEMATVSLADTVCAATGYCSSLTAITLTPLLPALGKIRQRITVTAYDGPYTITDGLLVTVSAPGYPTQTLSLVGGTVKYVQVAPSGMSVVLTVTFPEQKNAKLTASSATVTVVVP